MARTRRRWRQPGEPLIVVLGGPNGAGKTTMALRVLPDWLRLRRFVNADLIAKGLSPFDPAAVDLQAGRLMLQAIHALARKRESFGFETTLASRSFVPFLEAQRERGYRVHVIYVWLDSAALALQRVRERVRRGGHAIDEETVRRRYRRALSNFLELYGPMANAWTLCDNSGADLQVVAEGGKGRRRSVFVPEAFERIERIAGRWPPKTRRFKA